MSNPPRLLGSAKALIRADAGLRASLLHLFVLSCIHDIILVLDSQNLLAIESHLHESLIFQGQQNPSIFWYCHKMSARSIQKDSFLAGCPSIRTTA